MAERLRWRSWGVRARITAAATLVVALVLGVFAVLFVAVTESRLVDRVRQAATAELDRTASLLEQGLEPGIPPPLGPDGTDVLVGVFDNQGRAVGATPEVSQRFALAVDARALPPGDAATAVLSVAGPVGQQVVATRKVVTPTGPLQIVAVSPLADAADMVGALSRGLLVAVPVLVALVAAGGWVIVGRALRPIEAIRGTAEEITHSTLDRRLPRPEGRDEVARLADTMNGMLDRLESAARRQREFTSDASHELRSPIAVIRTELEVALRRPQHADWHAVAQAVLAEDARLERLVDDLLALARLQEGAVAATQPVELVALMQAEADRFTGSADVRLTGAQRLVVEGNHDQLARVVRNLLDNAVRHAQGKVVADLCVQGTQAVVRVDDDGPGIPPAERERVFARFTRLDDGRARSAGGVGLGLALARRIAQAHGGTVTAGAADLGGARLELRLPLEDWETAEQGSSEWRLGVASGRPGGDRLQGRR